MVGKEVSVKKDVVRLKANERELLEALIRKGKSPAQRLVKARILLKADVSQACVGWSDSRIIKAPETSPSMIYRVRKQLVEEGFEAVLSRKQRATPAAAPIFDGEKEAKLIALACSKPPKGRARWTLRLLERKVVELKIVERASNSTIGRVLKKTLLKPHRRQCWVIPPKATARSWPRWRTCWPSIRGRTILIARWFASTRLQSNSSPRRASSVPMRPGRPARCDYEYERNGTANLFMMFAPLEGWRCVKVRIVTPPWITLMS